MAGYTRQSSADIVPTAVVRATPLNNEFNAIRDAFDVNSGHQHDGSAGNGAYISTIADPDGKNKVAINTANNRVDVFVEVAGISTEQVRVQDGAIVPVTDNDIDLGSSGAEFKDLYIDGVANIDSLVADTVAISAGTINNTTIGATTPAAATVTNLTVNTAATIASADINAGTIDGAVIGGASAQAITGTTITATVGFTGGVTGNVTGNLTGNVTGNVAGNVTGNLTGNVTASSGTSTFNDVTINGGLNMNAGTSATITNLTSPTNSGDAATKGYVDAADALKLNLTGGTMSGAIAMGTSKITGVGEPTLAQDAATKNYVDTSIANVIDAAPAALDTLNELAAALGDDANFSTTITNSIATKLPLAGGTMSGAIAMGTSKITGLGDPTLAQDAATKTYVDTADALKLPLTGGTMSGVIAMGTSKITGLGDPTANQDAATKTYVDTADALKLSLTGGTMSGAIAMGTNKITGVGDPTNAQDVVTKNYSDTLFGSTADAATSAAAAATSASNAATSATNAGNSATAASTSETNAGVSETNAAASAAAAAQSAIDAAAFTPNQTGNSGKFLTTDGTDTSWATVDALPSQTGNAGKYLTTDGTDATWAVVNVTPALNDLSDVTITTPSSGEGLVYNGSGWVNGAVSGNTTTSGLYEMANTISTDYVIGSGNNAMSAGPITISSGFSVTIPSGSRWAIV